MPAAKLPAATRLFAVPTPAENGAIQLPLLNEILPFSLIFQPSPKSNSNSKPIACEIGLLPFLTSLKVLPLSLEVGPALC